MKAVCLDANLLVLLVVGLTSRTYIKSHKRLSAFAEEDYDLLLFQLTQYSEILFIPHVLAETSNLIKDISDPARTSIFKNFEGVIKRYDEKYVESKHGAAQKEFIRLGMTDSILLITQNPNLTLLTTDVGLYLAVAQRSGNVVNFNHLRAYR